MAATCRCARTLVFGGVGQRPQVDALARGVDILVATPGRLLDLLRPALRAPRRDRSPGARRSRPYARHGLHPRRQEDHREAAKKRARSLCFSATMPTRVEHLVREISGRSGPRRSDAPGHHGRAHRAARLSSSTPATSARCWAKCCKEKALSRVIVFTRTKHGANKVAEHLDAAGISADAIHGNKSQNRRASGRSRISATASAGTRRHRHRRARHRCRRRHPCGEFRTAGSAGKLCPPHRPHRARRRRGRSDFAVRQQRARLSARHREADPAEASPLTDLRLRPACAAGSVRRRAEKPQGRPAHRPDDRRGPAPSRGHGDARREHGRQHEANRQDVHRNAGPCPPAATSARRATAGPPTRAAFHATARGLSGRNRKPGAPSATTAFGLKPSVAIGT